MAAKELKMSRLSSKGQVTVPRVVRDKLNLNEGDRVLFVEKDGEVIVKKAGVVALDQFFKVVDDSGAFKDMSMEDAMNDIKGIRRQLNDERKRGRTPE